MSLVPSIADLVARERPEVLLLAAGGIGDGRGIAAALMLGADGALLLGTRFWATQEALIHPAAKARVVAATGDETVRTSVYDIVRGRDWPAAYTGRLMRGNRFIETWHGARTRCVPSPGTARRGRVRRPERRLRCRERHRRRGDRPRRATSRPPGSWWNGSRRRPKPASPPSPAPW